MIDRPKSFLDLAAERMRKQNPAGMPRKMEEENLSPLADFLSKNEIDVAKRPK